MLVRVALVVLLGSASQHAACTCAEAETTPEAECAPGESCNEGPATASGPGSCVDCMCEPGAEIACYSGPESTKGVGTCAPGVQTCAPDGKAFGVCVGEVVPTAENCITNADEDCDGISLDCGAGVWAKQFGSPGIQNGRDIDSDMEGRIFVVGAHQATIDFGCGPLTADAWDGFIAKLDFNGYCVWSRSVDPAPLMRLQGSAHASAVAVDSAGDAFVTGGFHGSMTLGASLLEAPSWDIFIAKIASDGTWLWARSFGNIHDDRGDELAVDAAGDVVVVGHLEDTIDFGGGPIGGGADVGWVLKLDGATGDHVWSHAFAGATWSDWWKSMAIDGAGNVVLASTVTASVDFGGGPLPYAGSGDLALVKLDPGGNHVWSKTMGATDRERFEAVAIAPTGDIWASGTFAGTVDFGLGPHTALGDTPDNPYDSDAFVLHFDPDGTLVSSRNFGGSAVDDSAVSLAVDPSGGVLISGAFGGKADLGGSQPPVPAGLYLMRIDDGGDTVWVTTYGAAGGGVLELDTAGRLFMAGTLGGGQLDFGSDVLKRAHLANDVFVARLTP